LPWNAFALTVSADLATLSPHFLEPRPAGLDTRQHETKEFFMRGAAWIIQFSVLLGLSIGCGDSQQSPPDNGLSGPAAEMRSGDSSPLAGKTTPGATGPNQPNQVVSLFYQALRSGDDASIAALLTDRAREETAKSGLAIQSQASDSLTYTIGETDYVTEDLDGAHVMSLWTEPDGEGGLVSTDVIWVLRKQQNGWKISGMATPVAEGQLPLLFNFENPEDMMQKKAYVESQVADANDRQPDAGAEVPPADMAPGTATSVGDVSQPAVTELPGETVSDLR
jgi:ketosteroid isomerase-like protein